MHLPPNSLAMVPMYRASQPMSIDLFTPVAPVHRQHPVFARILQGSYGLKRDILRDWASGSTANVPTETVCNELRRAEVKRLT